MCLTEAVQEGNWSGMAISLFLVVGSGSDTFRNRFSLDNPEASSSVRLVSGGPDGNGDPSRES